ncbi:MAG: hypothetical protein ACWA5X_03860 [bacterium]
MGIVSKFVGLSPHMRLALVIAPLLAVGGYVATDMYKEADVPDEQVYRLQAQGDCHLASGNSCSFSGMGLDATLAVEGTAEGGTAVLVQTSLPVKQVMLEAAGTTSTTPRSMANVADGEGWRLELPHALSGYEELHIVFSTRRAFLFLETGVD